MPRVALVVLTKDASASWKELSVVDGGVADVRLVVDSGSTDATPALASQDGWLVERAPEGFDHGGTRRWAFERVKRLVRRSGIVVFVTQDVSRVVGGGGVDALLAALEQHEDVGAAYGRQLPRLEAKPFEAHARLFNYPEQSEVRSFEDRARLGIKACFFSDSFAAYRVKALEDVGGFPERAIVGEDVIVAAKLLKAGWKIAYVADACVYHSHDLTPTQEMRRYFDIGVFHARESWILREFGNPEGEGLRFLVSEVRYLWERAPWLIPESLLRAGLKYVGYRLGRAERHLPLAFKRWMSLQRHFWKREAEELRGLRQTG
ncbi:MAG: glycosyltransferase [Armatimonadota bacterium]|nr:glycosyltransferase [Armatimonadota bacterium]